MPSMICGSGSLVTVTCAVWGLTIMRPDDDGTEVERARLHRVDDREAERAPLYGPVRYTRPPVTQ